MSSDYLLRLRAELLRAGAATQAPRRRTQVARKLRPLAAAVTVAALVATVVLTLPGERRGRTAGETITLTYRVHNGKPAQAAQILRQRLHAAGVGAYVKTTDSTLAVVAPATARADVEALTAPGRLEIFDWERAVLGPDGRPAPSDPEVTGGSDASRAAGQTEAEARARTMDKRKARVLRGSRGWFALTGNPALTNAEISGAHVVEDPGQGSPAVALDLTPAGRHAFRTLTRELARRGADQALPGEPLRGAQHIAFVLDDRILSAPYVNFQEAPDGIDTADGTQISGPTTAKHARLTAALLAAGPLTGALERSTK